MNTQTSKQSQTKRDTNPNKHSNTKLHGASLLVCALTLHRHHDRRPNLKLAACGERPRLSHEALSIMKQSKNPPASIGATKLLRPGLAALSLDFPKY